MTNLLLYRIYLFLFIPDIKKTRKPKEKEKIKKKRESFSLSFRLRRETNLVKTYSTINVLRLY